MKTIYQRLDEIIPKITTLAFCQNKGLGNEIGYWIFDYNPQYELLVREHIKFIKQKLNFAGSELSIREFDLYEIMLKLLETKGYLKKNFFLEQTKGSEFVFQATKKTLRLATDRD